MGLISGEFCFNRRNLVLIRDVVVEEAGISYHLFNGMPWVILWTLSAAALRTDS